MILTGRVDEPKKAGDSMVFPSYDEIVSQWEKYDLLDKSLNEFKLPFGGVIALVGDGGDTGRIVNLIPTQKDAILLETIHAEFFVVNEATGLHLIDFYAEPDSRYGWYAVNIMELSDNCGENGEKGFSQYVYLHN